jgi:hypothetical protein
VLIRLLFTSAETQSMVRQQAQAQKLTLCSWPISDNSSGYFGVQLVKPGRPKPYQARR